MGERLNRLWPSLVALIGTVAVVFGLLYFFGDRVTEDDPLADSANGTNEPSPDSSPTGTGEPTNNPTDDPTDDTAPSEPVTAPPELRVSVGVLNNTSINGLAASAMEDFELGGWTVTGTDDLSSVQIDESTVYYPTEDLRESAEAFAAQFPEVGRVEPRGTVPVSTQHLVVVLAADYAEETEGNE